MGSYIMVNKRLRSLCLLFLITVFVLCNMCLTASAAKDTKTDKKQTSSSPFKDVTGSDPNSIFITYINQQGIIGGFPDGNYYPKAGLTRAQAAVVLCKSAGLQTLPASNSSFKDVAVDHWAATYITAATKAGYLKGFADGTYQPESNLTRAQGVSLIMRLCTQREQAPLPALNDLNTDHWASASIGTALALDMIGLSPDGKNVYPDAAMSRGSLARALAILLTKDPGLNKVNLEGKLSEVNGQITLFRQGRSIDIEKDSRVVQGDQIVTGANSSVRLNYPDGSSSLVEANSEVIVKQSDGRRYIKQDGSSGIAVDYVNLDLKKGTIFDTVATKHVTAASQAFQNKTQYQLAALNKFRYLAANEGQGAPWYKTAETKKVKVKVDMPWGVAAIRGTFIKVTVNPDGTCQVACLTGSAEVSSNSGSSVALGGGQASGIAGEGAPAAQAGPMSADDKAGFDQVQAWVVDTALQQDINQPAEVTPVTVLLSIPDLPASEQQIQEQAPSDAIVNSAVQAVLDALSSTGIELRPDVVEKLAEQLTQVLEQVNPDLANELQNQIESSPPDTQSHNNNNGHSGDEVPIVYASPPSSVSLAAGSTHPVGGVTNVAIPAVGATNTTGAVSGWVASTADTIKFTVTDTSPAVSTITINGASYTSGTNYIIASLTPLTMVVTTTETGKATAVRTFLVSVSAPPDISGSFTDPLFKQAVWQWLGKTGTPGSFTKQDLTNRMAAQNYILGLTNNSSVTSLAGLENFEGTGLTRLNCYWDPLLTSLPTLPSSLTKIYCDYSGLTSLPALPGGLTELYANNNQLTSLPALPSGLVGSCDGNYLNIWAAPLLTNLSACPSVNKTPQYRYSYTGTAITLTSAGTRQLAVAELPQQQSTDGSNWGTPVTVSLGDFIFSTSDTAVATVSSAGLITAVGTGTCDIYAKYKNIDTPFTKVTIPVTIIYGTVSYNGNGNNGGTVPADASYASGGSTTAATVGSMLKTGCTFIGWNTAADWSGTDYSAGATINTAGTTTLYAKWQFSIAPDPANLGLKYNTSQLQVITSALPAYDRIELFISAAAPITEAAPIAGAGEGKYWLDLTVAANQALGWHALAFSEDANQMSYLCWYRYISGTAKSAWVSDGCPMGILPTRNGGNEYSFVGVSATQITFNNTSSAYNGYELCVIRSGSYVSLGTISSINQPFTVQANDQIILRNANGNYSYESDPYVY